MKIERPGKAVFRHSGITGTVIAANLIMVPIAAAALAQPARGNAIGAIAISAVLWVLWLLGWWSKVTITRSGVTVDNICVRQFIAWDDLADISYQGGIAFELKDGTKSGTLCYGGSLAGAITGYRGLQRIRDDILAARDRLAASPAGDPEPHHHQRRRRLAVTWWPALIYLALFETAALIAMTRH